MTTGGKRIVASLVALSAAAGAAPADAARTPSKILVEANYNRSSVLSTIDPSGRNRRRVAPHLWGASPRFSPDGRKLAFGAKGSHSRSFWDVAIGTFGSRRSRFLTKDDSVSAAGVDDTVTFTRLGIAFKESKCECIGLVRPDGSGRRRLYDAETRPPSGAAKSVFVGWFDVSEDGRWLVAEIDWHEKPGPEEVQGGILLIDLTSNDPPVRLTDDDNMSREASAGLPSGGGEPPPPPPEGERPPAYSAQEWEPQRITVDDSFPRFTPSGQIVFTRSFSDNVTDEVRKSLYIMGRSAGSERALPNTSDVFAWCYAVSPDGRQLAITRKRRMWIYTIRNGALRALPANGKWTDCVQDWNKVPR